MVKIFDEKADGFLFTAVFPFLLFLMAYYGFETSYVVGIKSWEKAPDFMFSSVYAYRIIPNFLSVHVTDAVTFIIDHYLPFAKAFLLKQGSLFYHSTFLINAFFFLLASVVLKKMIYMQSAGLHSGENFRRMIHLVAVFFIVILQYVPTNCDCLALFFYVSGMFFTLRYRESRKPADLAALGAVVFVSTLVRETSCLNIAFFAAVFIDPPGLRKGSFSFVKETVLLVLAFVVPYVALRLIIRQQASVMEGIYFVRNFTSPYNLAGLLFGILSMYFMYRLTDDSGKTLLSKYLFFSLPYLAMIALVGLFWEARLFLPLIITGIVIASKSRALMPTAGES